MSDREANALIDELLTLENPYHCPHGRPTIISMTKQNWKRNLNELYSLYKGAIMKKPLIVLTGPTAVGKTHLSIALAKAVNGEIISADSMQVYKYMDIGSAKIRPEEMQGVKHYLVDELLPGRISYREISADGKSCHGRNLCQWENSCSGRRNRILYTGYYKGY